MSGSAVSALAGIEAVNGGTFRLVFPWGGPAPRAGQFFMIRPRRTSVFLGRPVSVARWHQAGGGGAVEFLVTPRGTGTRELCGLRPGEEAELSGPLGRGWGEFLPPLSAGDMAALVSGGIGAAPLAAFAQELPAGSYDFYAGFRTAPADAAEERAFLGAAFEGAHRKIIAAEDGAAGSGTAPHTGRIPVFFDPSGYRAVFACGPEPMLQAVAEKCRDRAVPCFVSMERRMACGAGACLGCTVRTRHGNRRCCADGPVFPAEEILFGE